MGGESVEKFNSGYQEQKGHGSIYRYVGGYFEMMYAKCGERGIEIDNIIISSHYTWKKGKKVHFSERYLLATLFIILILTIL